MNRRAMICGLIVIAFALGAMSRCVRNDFVKWDDPETITDNPNLHPPTIAHAWGYWISPAGGLYVPLTYTAWSAIARYTQSAWAFHLCSILAHAVTALLCFRVLRRLIESDVAAMFGAVLFAAHPLQVEAVAWASGLKDVLAAMFALAAIDRHIAAKQTWRTHALAALFFALAMLAKPSAASAIPIALLLDLLILRKPRNAIEPLAWLVIALPLLVVARYVQETPFIASVDWYKRPLIAADALCFYSWKLIAPLRLCIDYGRFPGAVLASSSIKWTWIVPFVLAIALSIARNRALICAALILLAGLTWNLGLTPFQFQIHSTVADHYMYLAMLGPALAAAGIVQRWPRILQPILAVILIALTALSIRQAGFWHDSTTLFEHTLSINERSVATHLNLGHILGDADDLTAAEAHFRRAVEINPEVADAYRNLAVIALRRQDDDGAITNLTEAVRLYDAEKQNDEDLRSTLVKLLAEQSRWRDVVDQLERAAAANPDNPRIAQLLRVARARAATQPNP